MAAYRPGQAATSPMWCEPKRILALNAAWAVLGGSDERASPRRGGTLVRGRVRLAMGARWVRGRCSRAGPRADSGGQRLGLRAEVVGLGRSRCVVLLVRQMGDQFACLFPAQGCVALFFSRPPEKGCSLPGTLRTGPDGDRSGCSAMF